MINILGALFVVGITALSGLAPYFGLIPKPTATPKAIVTIQPSPLATQRPAVKGVTTTTVINNESQIDCWGPDGKFFKATKTECDNFNAKWGKPSQPIQTSTQKTTGSNYSYTPKVYYSCRLCYHYSFGDSCSNYNYSFETKEQCTAEQSRIDSIGGSYQTTVQITPAPIQKPDYSQQNALCKQGVNQWWTNVGSQYDAGTREAVRQIEYPNYQAKLMACDSQWPL